MITNDQARLLLTRAAETIRVDDPSPAAAPHSPPGGGGRPRRGWTTPAAIAAAVLVVVGAAVTIGRLGPDATPSPADQPVGPSVDRSAAPAPGDDEAPTAALREVADQFVAWAQDPGVAPPPFAQEVAVLSAGHVGRTVRGDVDRNALDLCPRGTASCYLPSALVLLRDHDGRLAYSRAPETVCTGGGDSLPELPDGPGLPEALLAAASGDLVRIGPARADSCDDSFAVELTVDDSGDISIVNTVVPVA